MDPQLYQALILGNHKFIEDSRDAGSCNLLQVTSGHKNTILHIAAICGGIKIAEKIIGFFPGLLHQTNTKGDSPLHVAARLGRLEMIQLLVNSAKLVEVEVGKELLRMENLDKDTALHVAVRNGHFEVVNLLICEDPELTFVLNSLGDSSLFLAVDRKFFKIAQHIIETVPSCFYGGRCAMNVLHVAIIRADKRFVPMDAMVRIRNFISIAFTMFINQFLPAAFKLSSLNFRQSCSFSYIGADFMQEVLKRHPSATKEADQHGWIPLHYAAYLGNAEVVELLLQFDVSLAYMKDNCGMAALHLSAKAGHVNVAQKLTAICPDTYELLDNHHRTALHVAAENGKRSVVNFFLKAQIYWDLMNEQDEVGNTPLHTAAVQGHSEVVLLLADDPRMDKGAVNKAGFTASGIIISSPKFEQHEKRQILCMLKARGVLRSLGQACTIVETEAGAQVNHQQTERTDPISSISGNEESSKDDTKRPEPFRSVNVVLATVIAAISFAAIFTIMIGDQDHEGRLEMLRTKSGFQLYMIANSVAFGLSTASMFLHFVGSGVRRVKLTTYAVLLNEWSVFGMVVAFAAGTALVCGDEFVGFTIVSVATACCCFCLGPLIYAWTR
ncbi:Protein ACCELERATED CELL DEATH 6 [Linum perenne]